VSTFPALENSHLLVFQVIENLPESDWEVPGVTGNLSVKETIAHLVAYERLIVDALQTFSGHEPTSELLRWASNSEQYQLKELEEQRYATAQQIEDEFQDLQVQANSLLELLSNEQVWRHGTLPWYKPEASLADFLEVMVRHMQSHCAQITKFRQNGAASSM